MAINVKIEKRDLWLLAAIMVVVIGVGYVIAFGGTQPSVMGHSLGEIDLPSCTTGQVLTKTASGWGCGSTGGTDTRCDTSGTCNQVCIGATCKSSWPPAAICSWGGVTYSTGAKCCLWSNYYLCQSDGSWTKTTEGCSLGTGDCGT